VDFHLALGTAAVLSGKFDMAVSQYQIVLGALGNNAQARADVYLRLGETYRRKGDLTNSIAALQQARQVAPDNAVVLSTLALALDGAGRRSEARQTYELALKADPNNGVTLNNLAFLLADSGGDLEQALTLAQKAKQLLPNLTEVSDTLGLIYLRKNLSDNAIDIFKDLVTKEPNHATYRYHLGMAFSQKGDKPRAMQELQHALKENPSKDEKEKIQQLMSRLG
jgi:tetratricopeptide (TPR) repeat protein